MNRDALNAQALSQFGLLTRPQLLTHGVTARFIEWRLSTKRWVTAYPGVYLTSPGRNDWPVRSMAAVLAAGKDAALSHTSAAFSYGLRKSPADRVEILVPHARRVLAPDGIRVQRCRRLAERIDEQAMPAQTTVEHTVLDLAAEGTADEAVALAALACQRGLTWDERLLEVLEARQRHPWMSLLREALHDVGEGAQSTFEVRYVRDVERAHRLPRAGSSSRPATAADTTMSGTTRRRCSSSSTVWPSTRRRAPGSPTDAGTAARSSMVGRRCGSSGQTSSTPPASRLGMSGRCSPVVAGPGAPRACRRASCVIRWAASSGDNVGKRHHVRTW